MPGLVPRGRRLRRAAVAAARLRASVSPRRAHNPPAPVPAAGRRGLEWFDDVGVRVGPSSQRGFQLSGRQGQVRDGPDGAVRQAHRGSIKRQGGSGRSDEARRRDDKSGNCRGTQRNDRVDRRESFPFVVGYGKLKKTHDPVRPTDWRRYLELILTRVTPFGSLTRRPSVRLVNSKFDE